MAIGDNIQVSTGKGVVFDGVVFPSIGWSLSKTYNVAPLFNARDGVNRKKTLRDASGSVNGWYDTDAPPHATIQDGAVGTILLATVDDLSTGYSFKAILDNVNIVAGDQTSGMSVSFDFALQSGPITDPV